MPPRFPESRVGRGALVRACALALAAALVAGCSTIDAYFPTARSFGVYKIDVNQGNYLSQEQVDKLKAGQTKQQVRVLLGTPLVASAFRDSRWDYVYEFQRQGRVVEHRKFTVYFVDDKLARWEGDEMPQSVAELNRAAAERAMSNSPGASKGFFDRVLDVFRTK